MEFIVNVVVFFVNVALLIPVNPVALFLIVIPVGFLYLIFFFIIIVIPVKILMDFDAVAHGILKIIGKLCILLATLEVFMAKSIHKPDGLISVAEQIEELLSVLSGHLSVICTCNEGHRSRINDTEINFLYKKRNVGIGISINSERNVLLWVSLDSILCVVHFRLNRALDTSCTIQVCIPLTDIDSERITNELVFLLLIGTTHRIDAKVFKGLIVLDILIIAHGIEA